MKKLIIVFVLYYQHSLVSHKQNLQLAFLILQETGLMETRMPNWERGVANILFTIS